MHEYHKNYYVYRFRKSTILFLMMGLNWIMELLTWLLKDKIPTQFVLGFDFFNAGQGLIILLLFVCNKNSFSTNERGMWASMRQIGRPLRPHDIELNTINSNISNGHTTLLNGNA